MDEIDKIIANISDEDLGKLINRLIEILTSEQIEALEEKVKPYRRTEIALRPEIIGKRKQLKNIPEARYIEFNSKAQIGEDLPHIEITHNLGREPVGFIPIDYDNEIAPRIIAKNNTSVVFATRVAKGKVRGILI